MMTAHDVLEILAAIDHAALAALAAVGFGLVADERPTRFVVSDAIDRRVDFHPVTFDDEGGGEQRLQDGSAWRYPAHGFLVTGSIGGQPVRCISADVQALAHLGYEPDAKDFHDMFALAAHFAIELPDPYRGPT